MTAEKKQLSSDHTPCPTAQMCVKCSLRSSGVRPAKSSAPAFFCPQLPLMGMECSVGPVGKGRKQLHIKKYMVGGGNPGALHLEWLGLNKTR